MKKRTFTDHHRIPIRWQIANGEILSSTFVDDRDQIDWRDVHPGGVCCIMANHATQTLYVDRYGITLMNHHEDESQ